MGREAHESAGGVARASRNRLSPERLVPGRIGALFGKMPLAVAPADQAGSRTPPGAAAELPSPIEMLMKYIVPISAVVATRI
jgi:hypothetical protein